MNKKFRGILFITIGIFYTYLLVMQDYYLNSIDFIIPKLLLTFCLVIFGKLSIIISILFIIYGVVMCMFSNVKLKFHKSKIVSLIALIFSTSIIKTIHKLPNIMPDTAYDSGIILLSIGFNEFDSGGLLGSLLSMLIYKFLLNKWTIYTLIAINTLSLIVIFRDILQFIFSLSVDLIKYYFSEEYRKKLKILKAKKESEKIKYKEIKKKREQEIRSKVLNTRKSKLNNKIARKPKMEQTEHNIFYSEMELLEKEKEWNDDYNRIMNSKKQKQLFSFYHEKNESDKYDEKIVNNNSLNDNSPNKSDAVHSKNDVDISSAIKDFYETDKIRLNENQENQESEKENVDFGEINSQNNEYNQNIEIENENNINNLQELNDENFEKDSTFIIENEFNEVHDANIENVTNEHDNTSDNINDTEPIGKDGIYKEDNLQGISTTYSSFQMEDYKELIDKSINTIFKSRNMDPVKKIELERSIAENVHHLEEVLKEFGIEAKVVNYDSGPTITRYEITIPRGVKVSKVTSLSDDIQMSLASESIRIEAPIPGKNTIGIETPNKIKEPVYFSNLIRNPKLDEGDLSVVLGKDVVGEDKILDIAKMPHLLIAGTTGSGKSVAINTIISTLITKKSEKEVKFIMIDPKMVELTPYNDIPHQLVPVIYDPNQAAVALQWSVNEMERRYKLLMANGVRNIKSYNNSGVSEKMPYIVIVIDELADLMMVAANSVETSIARIAQKARAVGIHLLLATQRPSTDVITGIIKANLPSRISFALKSQIDSRTILDSAGAEKLLGQGDMLLAENGSTKLQRIQGAFISDEEVIKLTTLLKQNRKVEYSQNVLDEMENSNTDLDPLYQSAINIIKEEGRVSISLLQGRLKVGFPRAQTIYNQLKETGVVSSDNELLIEDI